MDSLPLEVVEMIARLLSSPELAACAAVSRGWRRVFDHDILWSPRCIAALEEPLRTTPCVVDPPFIDPAPEDSSLGPVGRWRLAYMRESHLWNNYRHGNHKVVSFPFKSNNVKVEFISNDTIINMFYLDGKLGIQLYDVRTFEPTLLSESIFDPGEIHDDLLDFCEYKNKYISIVSYDCENILVYGIDRTAEKMIDFKFAICPNNLEIDQIYFTRTAILGVSNTSQQLHLWSLEQGNELKIENFPVASPGTCEDIIISETCEEVVTKIVERDITDTSQSDSDSDSDALRHHLHIYNPIELRYLSFSQVFELDDPDECLYECKIHVCYIVILNGNSCKIFNFHSQNLLFDVKNVGFGGDLEIIDDCFAIFPDKKLKMFHPPSLTLLPVEVNSCSIHALLKVINNSVIVIQKKRWRGSDTQFWKVKRHYKQKLPRLYPNDDFKLNASFTRTINQDPDFKKKKTC